MALIDEVRVGIRLWETGRAVEARELFARLWDEERFAEDALARCVLAHSIADIQVESREELRWDLIALEVAEDVTEEQALERAVPGGRLGLYPSLHLNLAEVYMRLGDDSAAAEHLHAGRRHLGLLRSDAYGARLREGYARVRRALREPKSSRRSGSL